MVEHSINEARLIQGCKAMRIRGAGESLAAMPENVAMMIVEDFGSFLDVLNKIK